MNKLDFELLVDRRLQLIKETLLAKGEEYQNKNEDVFHNFKVASRMRGISPEQALDGMLLKHLVSMQDIVGNTTYCTYKPDLNLVNEKIGDIINYYLLLEGLLTERSNQDLPF